MEITHNNLCMVVAQLLWGFPWLKESRRWRKPKIKISIFLKLLLIVLYFFLGNSENYGFKRSSIASIFTSIGMDWLWFQYWNFEIFACSETIMNGAISHQSYLIGQIVNVEVIGNLQKNLWDCNQVRTCAPHTSVVLELIMSEFAWIKWQNCKHIVFALHRIAPPLNRQKYKISSTKTLPEAKQTWLLGL